MKDDITQSLDNTAMRQHNLSSVFRYIRDNAPISRIDIASALKLNKTTVSSIVDDLMNNHFICEVGYGKSRGGRKPVILKLNSQAAYSIGIDIQITHATSILCDLNGEVIAHRTTSLNLLGGHDIRKILIEYLSSEYHILRDFVHDSFHGIVGMGIALPGMVNFQTGYVHYLPNLEIEQWDFKTEIEAIIGIPVLIDNDANCGAWAEYRTSGISDLVFINAGIGVGAGIITNGQLYRGSKGIAGEFGHMTIVAMGLQCTCGSYGCWELYASERGLVRYLNDFSEQPNELRLQSGFIEQCVKRADSGDIFFIQSLQKLGMYLGIGLGNVINALNPEHVFLGGNLTVAKNYLIPAMDNTIKHRTVPVNRSTKISFSSLDSVVIGAANLVMSKLVFYE